MKKEKKNIIVTGCAGFIGFHLCLSLLKSNVYNVYGIDNLNSYYSTKLKTDRLNILKKNKKTFKFHKIDISNFSKINALFKKVSFDIVINLAAQAGVRYSIVNPYSYVKSNLLGFSNILELCQSHDVKHLVYASSSSVYGSNKEYPFTEEHKVDTPLSFYAATKISNEMMANAYSNIYNLPITGLRFFTVYGPWGRPDMAPMIFADKIMYKKSITVFNHGNMSRDFTYISDIIEGTYLCCLKVPKTSDAYQSGDPSVLHRIFNIGNGNPVKLLEFIELLEDTLSIKAIKVFEKIQPGDVESTFASTQNLEKWVGYKPTININDGVQKFAKWYLDFYQ